jgi:nucleoside-diphosphate-sugar epimerase
MESVASIDYAGKALGFMPEYSFEKGLEKTYEYYLTTNELLKLDTDENRL